MILIIFCLCTCMCPCQTIASLHVYTQGVCIYECQDYCDQENVPHVLRHDLSSNAFQATHR